MAQRLILQHYTMDVIKNKICIKCRETKPLSEYNTNGHGSKGLKNKCKKCCNEENLNRYYANPEPIKSTSRKRNAKLMLENPEFRKANYERSKKWTKENPERYAASISRGNANRRARLKGSDGKYTQEEWIQMKKDYLWHCVYCGIKSNKLEADHVIPLSKGGANSIDNIVPSCGHCNSIKHNTNLLIWMWRNINYG